MAARAGVVILILVLLWLDAAASPAHADTVAAVARSGGAVQRLGLVLAQAQSVDQVLTNIRNWIMGILAGLATVFLTIGGVRYVMAAGDPGEVEKAKGAFRSAGLGYALAALAPLVVSVLRQLVGA